MKTLLIIGCGAHGRIVAETAELMGTFKVLGFGDDKREKFGSQSGRWKVLGDWRESEADLYVVAVGDNRCRERIFSELSAEGKQFATLVHPKAYVSPDGAMGPGTVILAGGVVSAGTEIGKNVILNIGAVVDHDARVSDHAHIAPNGTVASLARVESFEVIPPGGVRLRPA